MISARNLQLLSNGNKWCIVLLFSLLYLACSSSTTSASRTKVIKPSKPEVVEEEEMKVKVDTIQWTINSEDEYPPITIDPRVASFGIEKVQKDYYKIALLLPMRLQDGEPKLDNNNRKFADFYAGIKMAARDFDGLRAEVKVYYTNRDEGKLNTILDDFQYDRPDVIIASYESALIKKTAQFAKENRIPLISPWKSSNSIADDNLFYLQMRPSIDQYYKRIIDHVHNSFDNDEIVVVQRLEGEDATKTRRIQKLNEEMSALPIVEPMNTFDVELDSLMNSEANVFDTALVDGVKAFILPHFSSRDESFVYSCLRKMYGERGGRDFYVYTLPVALNSERIDINILKNLNIRTAEFRFPDPQNVQVQKFRKSFYQSNGWLPTEDAYYGYDLMTFIKYGLVNHGQYFHYFMAGEDLDLMQMRINIQPYFRRKTDDRPDFMANQHLYIIEYDVDHFVVRDVR